MDLIWQNLKKLQKNSQSGNFWGFSGGQFLKILRDFANSKIFGGIFEGKFSISGAFRGFQGQVATLGQKIKKQ